MKNDNGKVKQNQTEEFKFDSNSAQTIEVNVSSPNLGQDKLYNMFDGVRSGLKSGPTRINNGKIKIGIDQNTKVFPRFNFNTGSYTFHFNARKTTASASTTVQVNNKGSSSVTFNQSVYSVHRGDVANVTVHFHNTDYAQIAIGSRKDSNYQQNLTIYDDNGDNVAWFKFNTFAAGYHGTYHNGGYGTGNGPAIIDHSTGDKITHRNSSKLTTNHVLAAGTYQISGAHGDTAKPSGGRYHAIANGSSSDAVSTLDLQSRSNNGINTWVGPSQSNAHDPLYSLSSKKDIYNAIVNGELTQSSNVPLKSNGHSQVVVAQVKTNGVFGTFKNASGSGDTHHYFHQQPTAQFNFSANATDSNLNLNSLPLKLNKNSVGSNYVIPDHSNNTVFFVFNPGKIGYANGHDVKQGDNLASYFMMNKSARLAKHNQSVMSKFSMVQPSGTLIHNGAMLNLSQGSQVTVSGTTNFAPGTEMSVRLKSKQYIKVNKTSVNPDGSFTATFDTSNTPVGTSYSVVLKQGSDQYASVDGQIVKSTSTSTSTSSSTSMSSSTSSSTSSGNTPGFGVGIAIVALAGAALLALRRNN